MRIFEGKLSAVRLVAAAALLLVSQGVTQAQYLGFNLRGDTGIKSGTQPSPGYYLFFPLYFRADYDGLRNANGDNILGNASTDVNLLVPGLTIVAPFKIAGASYGISLIPMFMDQRLALARPDFIRSSGYGFGDMYIQPVRLGWTTSRADILAAYGFFAPTGSRGRSLDMWGHEISLGTTVYVDSEKKWSVAGTAFYEIHTKKANMDLRVGDILTVEGGVARSFLKGAANIGVAYVGQWKVTNDRGSDFSPLLTNSKNRAYGVGPEISLPVFAKGTLVGIFGFRYTFEFGARNSFEGQNLVVSFTLAKLTPN